MESGKRQATQPKTGHGKASKAYVLAATNNNNNSTTNKKLDRPLDSGEVKSQNIESKLAQVATNTGENSRQPTTLKSTKQTHSMRPDGNSKLRPSQNGQAASPSSSSVSQSSTVRRAQQKNSNNSNQDNNEQAAGVDQASNSSRAPCSTLEQFSVKAQEIKQDIYSALEKQSQIQIPDEPIEIVQLKNDILKLSGKSQSGDGTTNSSDNNQKECPGLVGGEQIEESASELQDTSSPGGNTMYKEDTLNSQNNTPEERVIEPKEYEVAPSSKGGQKISSSELSNSPSTVQEENFKPRESDAQKVTTEKKNTIKSNCGPNQSIIKLGTESVSGSFEPLFSKMDQESKYVSLTSSLKKDFEGSPGMLEPICKKLVQMSELISKLQTDCETYESENKKLLLIKQKLENLCRELQKSNNAIRIESLDLIKLEQGKAKEQTTKIQSTLSGVIKLFDENQQRNMTLRQENQELQTKLRSLLEHCDNWEKAFSAALKQRDIENRLVKTELAKANLLKNEEKERFLKEKQDLLQLLSMMQEHQSRIEGQEAKLRSDLSNYASKYDECQAVISRGMSKFQTESKRMLKQIEKSKQDYKVLLTKYESSNKRMAQLLDEKQRWDKSMSASNKKIETLEKLCRALREQNSKSSKTSAKEKINNRDKHQPASPSQAQKGSSPVAEVDTVSRNHDLIDHADSKEEKNSGISISSQNEESVDNIVVDS